VPLGRTAALGARGACNQRCLRAGAASSASGCRACARSQLLQQLPARAAPLLHPLTAWGPTVLVFRCPQLYTRCNQLLSRASAPRLHARVLYGHGALQDAVVPLQVRQLAAERRSVISFGHLRACRQTCKARVSQPLLNATSPSDCACTLHRQVRLLALLVRGELVLNPGRIRPAGVHEAQQGTRPAAPRDPPQHSKRAAPARRAPAPRWPAPPAQTPAAGAPRARAPPPRCRHRSSLPPARPPTPPRRAAGPPRPARGHWRARGRCTPRRRLHIPRCRVSLDTATLKNRKWLSLTVRRLHVTTGYVQPRTAAETRPRRRYGTDSASLAEHTAPGSTPQGSVVTGRPWQALSQAGKAPRTGIWRARTGGCGRSLGGRLRARLRLRGAVAARGQAQLAQALYRRVYVVAARVQHVCHHLQQLWLVGRCSLQPGQAPLRCPRHARRKHAPAAGLLTFSSMSGNSPRRAASAAAVTTYARPSRPARARPAGGLTPSCCGCLSRLPWPYSGASADSKKRLAPMHGEWCAATDIKGHPAAAGALPAPAPRRAARRSTLAPPCLPGACDEACLRGAQLNARSATQCRWHSAVS